MAVGAGLWFDLGYGSTGRNSMGQAGVAEGHAGGIGAGEVEASGEGHPRGEELREDQIGVEKVCEVLERLVAGGTLKNYAVGGATAAGFHGEPLATLDVDVFVFAEADTGSVLVTMEPVFAELAQLGFREFEKECVLIHGLPVQFLTVSSPLEAEAVSEARQVDWDGKRLRVMCPEHLAALALRTGRPKDRGRLLYLLDLPDFDRPLFEGIVQRHGLGDVWTRWQRELGLS